MKLEKTNNTDAGLAQEPATQNAYAETSAGRGSYWQLNPVFRELIDIYRDSGKKRGLKESTIYKTSFSASSFLLAMQNRGRESLNAAKPYVNLHGKGGKIRTAYLLPRAVEHIRIYLKAFHEPEANPEVYLFYSRVGGKYVKLTEPALDKRIKMYAADAHKKCPEVPLNTHAHQFRHGLLSRRDPKRYQLPSVQLHTAHKYCL